MASNKDKIEKKRKETIIDLSVYVDKTVRIKFAGGREVTGILKGYDPLLNMVLDSTIEYLRDPEDPTKITENTRQLGPTVEVIFPADGMEAISNPFVDVY